MLRMLIALLVSPLAWMIFGQLDIVAMAFHEAARER